jgi:hypothetical protein
MEMLAGDDLRGRGCSTEDEHAASLYLEGELQRAGVAPAFAGGMRQTVGLEAPHLASPATIEGGSAHFVLNTDFLFLGDYVSAKGRLVHVANADAAKDLNGAVVFYDQAARDRSAIEKFYQAGAVAVLFPPSKAAIDHWNLYASLLKPSSRVVGGENEPGEGVVAMLSEQASASVRAMPDGVSIAVNVPLGPPDQSTTYNVAGVIHGTDPDADRKALLLSAHYDHLGVQRGVIFHGADDDASGSTAVLEFARILAAGPRPRRTVYFVLFGCEESGGLGAIYFRAHPPTTLQDLAVNIEFEMIGNDDPKRPGVLMLTGWERSNLGPTLAGRGAHIGPDLYPEQHFFQRSDNYALARKGVVAQTVSAWPTPPTYHDPSDTLDRIDFPFMNGAIESMVEPVTWLLNSDFQPEWNPGQKP